MREPPANLSDETLRACLRTHYGLAVDELTLLPLGHDSSAWVYRVRTAGGDYFLKVRTQLTNEPSLLVPRYLHDHGSARVVAPLPTDTGALWTTAGGYALILYPFVAGTTGMERGMSERQWVDYGALLRQIHAAALPPDLTRLMRRESFTPVGTGVIRDLDTRIGARDFGDPTADALTTFWQARREDIRTLLERAEDLGRRLAQAAPAFVLCHADIHTNNVLLDAGGQVWIVDWDETILAPRERDLMFVVGGIIGGAGGAARGAAVLPGLRRGHRRSARARLLPLRPGGGGHRRLCRAGLLPAGSRSGRQACGGRGGDEPFPARQYRRAGVRVGRPGSMTTRQRWPDWPHRPARREMRTVIPATGST